ncbi:MAG: Druantia anti-phage system protein DruA [Verrucomicrobiota bacterium]
MGSLWMRELNKVLNMGLFIYVAEYQGQWLALPGWSAAAYPIRARDQWIGWNDNQRRVRLPLVASNARFCLLTDRGQYPNLASRVLALNGARLSQDWQEACGHPILLAESFVDTQLFGGAAYKAAAASSGAASKPSRSRPNKWVSRMSCNWRAWAASANSAPDARRCKPFG